MTIRNRELSQFGSFIYVENSTQEIGITTGALPYVGIGTTNPQYKLDVNGDTNIVGILTVGGSINASSFFLNGNALVNAAFDRWESGTGDNIYRLNGNVGIGFSNPSERLSVNGNVSASRFISTVSTGTAPFTVTSTTEVANLNASLLRGGVPGQNINANDIVTLGDTQTLTNKRINGTGIVFNGSSSGVTTVRASAIASGTIVLPAISGITTVITTGDTGTVTSNMIADLNITNSDVSNSAAIAYSKLSLTGSVVNADIVNGTIQNAKLVNSTISGVALGSSLNNLTAGSFITYNSGTTYNGSAARTIGVAATTEPQGSTIVARNPSGDFSAGTVSVLNLTATQTVQAQDFNSTGFVRVSSGTTASPGIQFGSASNGIHNGVSNSIDIVTNGSTTLRVNSNQTLVSSGTTAIPGLSFIDDTNTGFTRSAADQIEIICGGTEEFVINQTAATFAGTLSAPTVNASTTLQIGGVSVTSTAAELNILDGVTSTAAELNILDGVTSTAAELNILDGVTSTAAELNILDGVTSTAAELNLVDGSSAGTAVNSKAVIYGSTGFVRVSSGTGAAPGIQFGSASNGIHNAVSNTIDTVTNGTTSLRVNSNQTLVPSGITAIPGLSFIDDTNTGIYNPAADTLAIVTNGTERVRVSNSGLFVDDITVASPDDSTPTTGGQSLRSNDAWISNGGTGGGTGIALNVSRSGYGQIIQLRNGNTPEGGIQITNDASPSFFNGTSDIKFKKNIVDAPNDSGYIIDNIKVRSFDWNRPNYEDKHNLHVNRGFIAQELQEVLPECVFSQVPDEKDIETDPYLTIESPNTYVLILIQEVQSLRKRVAQLEGN